MSAGTAYSKRYAGGFVDKPSTASPIDSTALNAIETALLQLMGSAPSVDAQVMQWDFANTRFGPALLLNKNVDPAAAIASTKVDFTGGNALVNAQIAGAAAIARSKLDFGAGLVNADLAVAAAIALSKLAGYPSDITKVARGDGSWGLMGEPLFDSTVSGSVAASIDTGAMTMTGVKALLVMLNGRSDKGAATLDSVGMQFNNDTGNNYAWGDTDGTSAASVAQMRLGYMAAATAPTNSASTFVWIIHDPSNAVFNKTIRTIAPSINDAATPTFINKEFSGTWKPASPAAITRIKVFGETPSNFVIGTRLTVLALR